MVPGDWGVVNLNTGTFLEEFLSYEDACHYRASCFKNCRGVDAKVVRVWRNGERVAPEGGAELLAYARRKPEKEEECKPAP